MPDRMTPAQRSYLMSRVKGKDTKPEMHLRSALHHRGLRFRKHLRTLPGSPDIVFTRIRLAVFVDGDFWHGRELDAMLTRGRFGDRREYWEAKLRRNIARDQRVDAELAELGWQTIRVWESDIQRDLDGIADMIVAKVKDRRTARQEAPSRRRRAVRNF